MGYTKYTGSDEAQYKYIVDTDSDIENLPTSAKGSMAMSIESGNFYALNSNNEWTSVGAGSSGGGGGSVLIVEGTLDNSLLTLNKTWKEIHDALLGGSVVVYKQEQHEAYIYTSGVYACTQVYDDDGSYTVDFGKSISFTTSSETGYPSYDYGS